MVLVWAYQFLTTGTITVTAKNPSDNVSVSHIIEGKSKSAGLVKQTQQKLTVRVKPGRYEVSVGNRSAVSTKTIDIKARQHLSFTLGSSITYSSEPVLGQGAESIATDPAQLLFIDPSSRRLMRVDSGNNLGAISNSPAFASVKWNSISLGVGLSEGDVLFAVNNGTFSEIPLPILLGQNEKEVDYALTSNGLVYVSDGAEIYKGNLGGSFEKIYTAGSPHLRLSASDSRLAVSSGGTGESEGAAGSDEKPKTVILDSSGKVLDSAEGEVAHRLAWSKNGQYLLAQGNSGITVYDSSFRLVKTVPVEASIGIAWVNAKEFVYGAGNAVWKTNVQSNQSEKITRVGGSSVDELSVSFDENYVYTVSPKSDTSYSEVARTNLRGGLAPRYLQTLDIFLPKQVGVCFLSYVNFTKPAITLSYPASTTTADFCINAGKGELKYYNIDPNKFVFQTNSASVSE
jgi:hypothetical protein